MARQPKSFRLTPEAVEILARLAGAYGVSETAIVEIAVRKLAEQWSASPPTSDPEG